MIPVQGHPNLYRDEKSGAIINTDTTSYDQYVNSISSRSSHKKEIENLKNEVSEIKSLIRELINESRRHKN
jgi:hypothetical protein